MINKQVIDITHYHHFNPIEIVATSLLKFYLDSEDDELRISLDVEKIGQERKKWGMYSMKNKRAHLLTAPLDHIIPALVEYLKNNSISSTHRDYTLYVHYNSYEYKIPLFLSDEKGKEEIMFRKPKKLEQRV